MHVRMMTKGVPALALLLALGCGEAEETAADPSPVPAPAPAEPEGPPGPVAGDETFELRAEAAGPYTAGEEGTFEIRLTPRGVYHVNEDYPMAIALSGPDGVTLPGELGNDDAAEHSEQRARFSVPFTAGAAGEHTVTAEVDFAVCTPEACMPDHATLALVLPVR